MRFLSDDMTILSASTGAESTDMSVDLVSQVYDIRSIFGYSVQAEYSGTPNGTLKLQVSNDDPKDVEAQDWTDLTDSDIAISSPGIYVYNVQAAFYGWLRLAWDVTSGTGTLSAKIVTKGG